MSKNGKFSENTKRKSLFATIFVVFIGARGSTWTTTGTSVKLSLKTLTIICSILEAAVVSHILKLFASKVKTVGIRIPKA